MKKTIFIKKALSLFLIAAILIAFPVAACAESVPVLRLGSISAQQGELLGLPVSISDMDNLTMMQFALCYDAELLVYDSFAAGELLRGKGAPTINGANPGIIYFVWDDTDALPGNGEIGSFLFKSKTEKTGFAAVSIDTNEEIVFADNNLNIIEPGFVSGNIAIFDCGIPISATTIEKEAFEGCAFSFARLSDNIESIGPRAFANCPNLVYIIIPTDNVNIDPEAFAGDSNLTIIGPSSGTAEVHAQHNAIEFLTSD